MRRDVPRKFANDLISKRATTLIALLQGHEALGDPLGGQLRRTPLCNERLCQIYPTQQTMATSLRRDAGRPTRQCNFGCPPPLGNLNS